MIVVHCIFWVSYFSFNSVRWGHYFGDYIYSIKSNLVEFPIHITLVYFNLYWLVPKLLQRKKYGIYVIMLFLATLTMSIIKIVLTYDLVTTNIWPESAVKETHLFGINYIVTVFLGELYIVGLTAGIKMTIDRITEHDLQRELEKNNLETELVYLKNQMQPHFFFNTLNSLYALSLEKSDLTPHAILKLSNMMNFVIYRSKADVVSLTETVTHMKNFIELEKIRFGSKLNVDLEISGRLDGRISPLILSSFVENSIKHGGESPDGTIDILIKLTIKEKHLKFEVENWLQEYHGSQRLHKHQKGMGLQNTIRRLKLLYQNRYQLDIHQSDQKYKIKLFLPFNE